MTEIVEPNPLLIEYLQIAYNTPVNDNLTEFFEAGEWHYIQSDLETNIRDMIADYVRDNLTIRCWKSDGYVSSIECSFILNLCFYIEFM